MKKKKKKKKGTLGGQMQHWSVGEVASIVVKEDVKGEKGKGKWLHQTCGTCTVLCLKSVSLSGFIFYSFLFILCTSFLFKGPNNQ